MKLKLRVLRLQSGKCYLWFMWHDIGVSHREFQGTGLSKSRTLLTVPGADETEERKMHIAFFKGK